MLSASWPSIVGLLPVVRRSRSPPPAVISARLMGGCKSEGSSIIGVSEQTYYRWKNLYGGMKTPELRRLKELEQENLRLKKLVADLSLDNAMLKELAEGNF